MKVLMLLFSTLSSRVARTAVTAISTILTKISGLLLQFAVHQSALWLTCKILFKYIITSNNYVTFIASPEWINEKNTFNLKYTGIIWDLTVAPSFLYGAQAFGQPLHIQNVRIMYQKGPSWQHWCWWKNGITADNQYRVWHKRKRARWHFFDVPR